MSTFRLLAWQTKTNFVLFIVISPPSRFTDLINTSYYGFQNCRRSDSSKKQSEQFRFDDKTGHEGLIKQGTLVSLLYSVLIVSNAEHVTSHLQTNPSFESSIYRPI